MKPWHQIWKNLVLKKPAVMTLMLQMRFKKQRKLGILKQLLLNLQKSLPMKKIEMQELLRGKLKRWIYLDLLYSDVPIIYNLSCLISVPVSICIFKFYIIFLFIIINQCNSVENVFAIIDNSHILVKWKQPRTHDNIYQSFTEPRIRHNILPSNAESSQQNRGLATGGCTLIRFRAPRIKGRFCNYVTKLHYILKCAARATM